MPKYEDLLDRISGVDSTSARGIRDVKWLTSAEVLGVARDKDGRLEVFLVGAAFKATTPSVIEALQYHIWHREKGEPLPANRLLLPALGHFDAVAAFICTELLRNGADQDIERAFRLTEPIIELAIERLLLSESALLGLAGELLLFNALCHQVDEQLLGKVVASWDGWRRSSRDFHWEGTGVELKTTIRSTSSHMIQGVHQIDLTESDSGERVEDRLLLVSVGLQRAEEGLNSFSIPVLVQRIIDRFESTGNQAYISEFLTRVGRYGSESGFGYDHLSMRNDAPFTSTFTIAFFRGYDMTDPAVKVLRRDDVAMQHHVEMQSVSFRITLPAILSAMNPIAGANQVARGLLNHC